MNDFNPALEAVAKMQAALDDYREAGNALRAAFDERSAVLGKGILPDDASDTAFSEAFDRDRAACKAFLAAAKTLSQELDALANARAIYVRPAYREFRR